MLEYLLRFYINIIVDIDEGRGTIMIFLQGDFLITGLLPYDDQIWNSMISADAPC